MSLSVNEVSVVALVSMTRKRSPVSLHRFPICLCKYRRMAVPLGTLCSIG